MLAVVHNYLTLPEVVAAQAVIDSGQIGVVKSAIVDMLGIVYEAGAAGDWHRNPALASGGVLMDIVVHAVYLAESLAGEPILRASAHIGAPGPNRHVEDLATCRFEARSHVALVNIGWGYGPGGVFVTGTDGRIDIRYDNGSTPPWANLEHVRVTTAAGTREILDPATGQRVGLGDFPSHSIAFRAVARAFAEAAHGLGRPIATGTDGLRALEATIAAYVSAATGRTVPIPLDRDSTAFQHGSLGVPKVQHVAWSPFTGTQLFRPTTPEEASA
jgi:UDP-N-acetyl-2-amino-2-deoxyglucuronate dehydrogenase